MPPASRMHESAHEKMECPGAQGVGRAAESGWGTGTLKAAKGLANFRTPPRVKDERIVRQDLFYAIQ